MNMMIVAAAFSLLSTAAFAGAHYDIKGESNTDTNGKRQPRCDLLVLRHRQW
jgi:uncharacterized protein YdeI (BOF family)